MKTIFALTYFFTFMACAQNNMFKFPEPAFPKGKTLSVTYTNFNRHAISLEFDAITGCVWLKAKPSEAFEFGANDYCVKFMRDEVVRVISTTNTALANGYSIRFSGYPIWEAYTVAEKSGIYRCLIFARGATMTNQVIIANGWPNIPPNFENYYTPNK